MKTTAPTAAAPMAADNLKQPLAQDTQQNALDLSSPNIQIIRSPHKVNYSVVNNIGIDDPRLDPTALAILLKRIRKPDTWKLIPKALAKEMGKNIETIRKYIRQLIKYGYLVKRVFKNPLGQYAGHDYVLVEDGTGVDLDISTELVLVQEKGKIEACKPHGYRKTEKAERGLSQHGKVSNLINTKKSNYRPKQIQDLSPTPQFSSEEEIDIWSDSYSDSSQVELSSITQEPEPSKIDSCETEQAKAPCTEAVPGVDEYSAAAAEKTIVSTVKPTRKERRSARHDATWVEFGQQNGLWQSLEELQSFMAALYAHAVNNPRLHTPSKWVESEVQKTIERGTGTHWTEYCAGLQVGTIDQKPWADVHGNVNLSFRSYIEQSKMGESGNSTSRAVELAAQVLSNPFKAGLMWNEYQRRLEREVAEKAKCELLGVTYDAPGVLKPKPLIDNEATAQTQQLLRIDDASQVCQPVMESIAPALALEAEVESAESLVGEAPWDAIAEKMVAIEESQCQPVGIMEKMERLREKMGFSKPEVTPLSDAYREPKPVDQVESKEFAAWYNVVKAAHLVNYSYSDPHCHAVVVMADGVTVLPWRDARDLLAKS
jgi:hypothetical protein